MKKLLFFGLLLGLAGTAFAVLGGTFQQDLEAAEPERKATATKAGGAPSSADVTLDIEMAKLQPRLQKAMGSRLYFVSGKNIGNDCTLELKVDLVGAVSLTTANGKILASVPLRAWGRVDWSITKRIKFGIGSKSVTTRHHEDFDSRLTVAVEVCPAITPSWKLTTRSELNHHWNQKPTLTVGPAKVRITSHADPEVKKQLRKLATKIDQELSKLVNLRAEVEKVWKDLHLLRRVSTEPAVWLRSTPEALGASPFRSKKDVLSLDARVVARLETVVGSKPKAPKLSPLPKKSGASAKRGIKINADVRTSYTDAAKMMESVLADRKLKVGEKSHVSFSKIELYPSGKKLVIGADFATDGAFGLPLGAKGRLFLVGTPVYDEAKRQLTVPDLNWDVETKNLLLKGAKTLLDEAIRDELRDAARFDLSASLDDAENALRKSLDELEKLDDVRIQANVGKIKPSQPRIDARGIALTLTLTGQAKASLR